MRNEVIIDWQEIEYNQFILKKPFRCTNKVLTMALNSGNQFRGRGSIKDNQTKMQVKQPLIKDPKPGQESLALTGHMQVHYESNF